MTPTTTHSVSIAFDSLFKMSSIIHITRVRPKSLYNGYNVWSQLAGIRCSINIKPLFPFFFVLCQENRLVEEMQLNFGQFALELICKMFGEMCGWKSCRCMKTAKWELRTSCDWSDKRVSCLMYFILFIEICLEGLNRQQFTTHSHTHWNRKCQAYLDSPSMQISASENWLTFKVYFHMNNPEKHKVARIWNCIICKFANLHQLINLQVPEGNENTSFRSTSTKFRFEWCALIFYTVHYFVAYTRRWWLWCYVISHFDELMQSISIGAHKSISETAQIIL